MNRIKEYRTNLGITQKQLADNLGVYQATVNRYERGRDPKIQTCWDIINSLRSFGAKCGIEDVFPDSTTTKKSTEAKEALSELKFDASAYQNH